MKTPKYATRLSGLFLLLAVALLFSACGSDSKKEKPSSDETAPTLIENDVTKFLYESDGKEITVTGYAGIESSITIPSELEGLPVTVIAENAFRSFTYLEKVVIPDSVHTIDFAFVSCEDLQYVYIGKGVTSMNGAFRGCTSLETVSGGSSVEYMDEAFFGCKALTKGTIPSSVQSALSAFSGCTSLSAVDIQNGIPCLDKTFSGCTNLRSVSIPESVIYLVSAFLDCSALTEVTGGGSVSVYNNAFRGCVQLKELTLSKEITELISAFVGCISLETVQNLPLDVEKYTASFSSCRSLKEIVVPAIRNTDSLVSYSPSEDFAECEAAVNVCIYADFTVREEFCKAFSGLRSLEELTIPASAAKALLRVSWSYTDALYEGNDKKVTTALKSSKSASTVRVTDDYAVIEGQSYTHIYGGDVYAVDLDQIQAETDVTTFTPYEATSYWCGYPTGGNRKKETVAVERTFSFFLRTTGKNEGALPESLTINGQTCAIGE